GSTYEGSMRFMIPSGVHHFALVTDHGTQARLYMDGEEQVSTPMILQQSTSAQFGAAIGAKDDSSSRFLVGFSQMTVYGVRISDTARYSSGFSPSFPLQDEEPGVVANYRLATADTAGLEDSAGNFDGNIIGAHWEQRACPR